jgi:hypothetical protein
MQRCSDEGHFMSISDLQWFIQLGSSHPTAPTKTALLCSELTVALTSSNFKQSVTRTFRKHTNSIKPIHDWLTSDVVLTEIKSSIDLNLKAAYDESNKSLSKILSGISASIAWGLGKQRGINAGFSRTLEAAALVKYLTEGGVCEYSKSKAQEISAKIFEINVDEIRKYQGLEPLDIDSAIAIAFSAILRADKTNEVDHYFDFETLMEMAQKS